jgi:hypothetical protein
VNIYNSANGADIRFKEVSGADSYVIMKKTNGVWSEVVTVKSSELTTEGGNFKYIDTSVKNNYGKGYIYSVAAKKGTKTGPYDTVGLALYRLEAPKISKVKVDTGFIYIYFNEVDAHGYEVQFADMNDTSKWYVVSSDNVVMIQDGFAEIDWADTYNFYFRIRCYKTNANRGTTYSQYSNWGKVTESYP